MARWAKRRTQKKHEQTGFKHSELYGAKEGCDGEVVARMSGVGCNKCPGWYCL